MDWEERLAVKIKESIGPMGGTRGQQGSKGSGGETQGQGPVRAACQSEIERLCPGEKQAGHCLRSHSPDQLSEACKAALASRGSW